MRRKSGRRVRHLYFKSSTVPTTRSNQRRRQASNATPLFILWNQQLTSTAAGVGEKPDMTRNNPPRGPDRRPVPYSLDEHTVPHRPENVFAARSGLHDRAAFLLAPARLPAVSFGNLHAAAIGREAVRHIPEQMAYSPRPPVNGYGELMNLAFDETRNARRRRPAGAAPSC